MKKGKDLPAYACLGVLVLSGSLLWGTALIPHYEGVRENVNLLSLPVVSEPARADYGELNGHPLFVPGRRMPPPLPKPQAVPVVSIVPLSLTLLGVMMEKDAKAAVVKRPGAKEVIVLHEGQVLQGWTLEHVTANGVTLTSGGAQQILVLPKPLPGVVPQK